MSSVAANPARHETMPHLFGANAMQYRQGTLVANAETPPAWWPDLALNPVYPYTLKEYARDIGRWIKATRVTAERLGPLISLSLGGAARTIIDEVDDDIVAYGCQYDFGDGRGYVHRTGPECIMHILRRKFPHNAEAEMLRAGLEFFSFTPAKHENMQMIMLHASIEWLVRQSRTRTSRSTFLFARG